MTDNQENAQLSELIKKVDSHSRWKPIYSAPRNGDWFFAKTAFGVKRLVHYADSSDRYPISHDGVCWSTEPIEWMDLPSAAEVITDLKSKIFHYRNALEKVKRCSDSVMVRKIVSEALKREDDNESQ